jgi:hypothetical protein
MGKVVPEGAIMNETPNTRTAELFDAMVAAQQPEYVHLSRGHEVHAVTQSRVLVESTCAQPLELRWHPRICLAFSAQFSWDPFSWGLTAQAQISPVFAPAPGHADTSRALFLARLRLRRLRYLFYVRSEAAFLAALKYDRKLVQSHLPPGEA